jgi:hypothetical protein
MKDFNYIQIEGWMITRLGLKGNDLLIYAIIYGFSQDGESVFSGSSKYIMKALQISQPTVLKSLKILTEKGFIIKESKVVKSIILNDYKVSLVVLKNFKWGTKESLVGGTKDSLVLYTNKDNTKDNTKKSSINRTKKRIPTFYKNYSFFKKEFKEMWFEEFLPIKVKKKASTSDRALIRNLNKIQKYSDDDFDTALDILTKSVDSGWSDVYELDNRKKLRNGIGSRNHTKRKHEYDEGKTV